MQVASDELESGVVAEEFQKGYMYHDTCTYIELEYYCFDQNGVLIEEGKVCTTECKSNHPFIEEDYNL